MNRYEQLEAALLLEDLYLGFLTAAVLAGNSRLVLTYELKLIWLDDKIRRLEETIVSQL